MMTTRLFSDCSIANDRLFCVLLDEVDDLCITLYRSAEDRIECLVAEYYSSNLYNVPNAKEGQSITMSMGLEESLIRAVDHERECLEVGESAKMLIRKQEDGQWMVAVTNVNND